MQGPKRLCYEFLNTRKLASGSIYVPGTEWVVLNKGVECSEEGAGCLKISGCKGKDESNWGKGFWNFVLGR